jgi:DNA-binding transcriptional MerR regulator
MPELVKKTLKKLYYSISEVAEITKVQQHVLRFWEMEFSQLNPSKNSAGKRNYTIEEINLIFEIKRLLYDEKFTISGARNVLKNLKVDKEKLAGTLEEDYKAGLLEKIKK